MADETPQSPPTQEPRGEARPGREEEQNMKRVQPEPEQVPVDQNVDK